MASVVTVSIKSPTSEFPTEKRYDPNIKILELKKKLELITGAIHTSMKITLFVDDKELGVLASDEQTLAHYLGDQYRKESSIKLMVEDEQPSLILQGGEAPKFVISEDKYLQRPDNARNFIKELREKRLSGQSADGEVAGGQ